LYKGKNAEGRPRILMNPAVRLAYEKTWYHWNNTVLRRPVIRWWVSKSSLGYQVQCNGTTLSDQIYGVMV
jgi:hypothetical protein